MILCGPVDRHGLFMDIPWYIVKHMIEESGYGDVKVVATGGLGSIIAKETDCIDVYDPNLTLQGMRFIYNKQKRS